MELNGQYRLPADRALVWQMLNDVAVLEACVPGTEAFTEVSDGRYEVAMLAAIGPVRARFIGKIEIADVDPPNGYTLKFDGQGGAAGFARGHARLTLTSSGPDETMLSYVADAHMGGKLSQLASRVVDAAAGALIDRFFGAFTGQLTARCEPAVAHAIPYLGGWAILRSFLARLFGKRKI